MKNLAATMCLLLLAAGCQKDQDLVTIRADITPFGDEKVGMTRNDNGSSATYTPSWQDGDILCVNEFHRTAPVRLENGTAIISVPKTASYKAVYPNELVTGVDGNTFHLSLPEMQEYAVDDNGIQCVYAPLGAYCRPANHESALQLQFTPMGSLMAIEINNDYQATSNDPASVSDLVVERVEITATNNVALWGDATVENIKAADRHYTIDNTVDGSTHNALTLAGKDGKSMKMTVPANQSKIVYLYIPSVTNAQFSITIHAKQGRNKIEFTHAQSTANSSVSNGNVAKLTYSLNTAEAVLGPSVPAGSTGGKFNVGTENNPQYVYLSNGNLQYRGSTGQWRFAEHQYDYVGNVPGNSAPGTSQTEWMDLFRWGASGSTLLPYSTGNSDVLGNTSNIQKTEYDWGWHNSISTSDGTADPHTWYTLTSSQWSNLLEYNLHNIRGIEINATTTTYGLIIIPVDLDWDELPDELNTDEFTESHWSLHDNISLSEWETLEEAGCAFLPLATGYYNKDGNYVLENKDRSSYYWTSTPKSDKNAYALWWKFKNGAIDQGEVTSEMDKKARCFVRLAMDAPAPDNDKK